MTKRKEFLILAGILIVAAFCRLYKIDQYMTFLGDEGRDVIVVRKIFTEFHPPLIGPGTSIGNMYLGPIYYYMMAPALLLAGFSPVGPAIQIAILGVATVWFTWWAGREWFGKIAGLITAGLYAISPTVIIFSRSSWNPNIMPFFALLSMYSIWKVWKDHKFSWLIVLGISYAFVLQSHYLGLLLAPTILLFWVLTFRNLRLSRNFLQKSLVASLIFAGLMSPLLFFDLRHNFMNFKAMITFFGVRQETVSIKPWNSLPKIPEILRQIDTSLVGGKNEFAGGMISGLFFVSLLYSIVVGWKKLLKPETLFLISWLGFGLIGFGLYKQQIYDHYYGFTFVVPYLLIGAIVGNFFKDGKVLKALGVALLVYLVVVNLLQNPLRFSPNRQLQRSVDVADKILEEDSGKPFNLAVLAERNYEDGYRYFLELRGAKVLHADRWDKATIGDQLFVVCEMEEKKCDPTHSPKAEVANFGMSKIDQKWEVDGVITYRLIHSI